MNKKLSLLFFALLLSVLVLSAVGCNQHQPAPTDQVILTVDYDRSIEVGVRAGHYDHAHSYITDQNFPTTLHGTKEISVQLIHFNKPMSTDSVLAELDKRGLRPANLQECLAFGEKYPDIQREFPVMFLGRRFGDSHYCPDLNWDGSERSLSLYWIGNVWHDICRFAAVSKSA